MFENLQDTVLLHGALLSADPNNSESLCDCKALEYAVNIVSKSVAMIVLKNVDGIKNDKENVKVQLLINKRLHAAVFFTTLRSHGLTSDATDDFYSSIINGWPTIDFKFYMELNFKCDWSDYFIKCASQLPAEILYKVLKIILDFPFPNHIKFFSWHLTLQTLILKLLEIPYCDEMVPFDFSVEDSPDIKNQINKIEDKGDGISNIDLLQSNPEESVSLLKDLLNNLYDYIDSEIKLSMEVDVIKIILHAVKTLLKNLLLEKERNYKNILKFCDFLKIYDILTNFLMLDANQEILKVAMSNYENSVVTHTYASTSWNISESYLNFLIFYYANKMRISFSLTMQISSANFDIYSEMLNNNFIYDNLKRLNSLFTSYESDDKRLNFLFNLVQLDFEGASFAAEMLLKPALLKRYDTLKVLEENCHVIDFKNLHQLMLRCAKAVNSDVWKFEILKIFYKSLAMHEIGIYNEVLISILSEYGFTDHFQQSDFHDQLSQCIRKVPTVKQAEETFPALFVQNPLIMLNNVLDQALIRGPEGKPYIESLKHVSFVCTYQSDKDDVPLLVQILDGYFENRKLEPMESKNMVTLYKLLMMVHSEYGSIMLLDEFFKKCIIPKLELNHFNIKLILECLYESLTILMHKNSFNIEKEILMLFIVSLGKLIHDCIETSNGEMKELTVLILKNLEIHQQTKGNITDEDKVLLWSKLKVFNEVVSVYLKEFCPANIEFSSNSFLWTWCCKNKDFAKFADKTLSYASMINTLVEVLPHFTKEEWLHSVDLVKTCCKNDTLKEEILDSSDMPFQLSKGELDIYAVISCFICSLHLILLENKRPVYIINCFNKSLIDLLSEEKTVNSHLAMTVFFDFCQLVESVSHLGSIVTSVLLDLIKLILSITNKDYEKDCRKLISYSVESLPDSCDKNVLLPLL